MNTHQSRTRRHRHFLSTHNALAIRQVWASEIQRKRWCAENPRLFEEGYLYKSHFFEVVEDVEKCLYCGLIRRVGEV